jgi:carbon-monoxide dehydrogenase small subunit
MSEYKQVKITVNGVAREHLIEPRQLLCDSLRDDLGLTGTHVGCEHGVCGACTVLVDGRAARSCLMFAVQADGASIDTIEGLSNNDDVKRLQELFAQYRALQCGFCTPGMLVVAHDLMNHQPNPSHTDIVEGMSAALCRCTGYQGIVKAVTHAARERADGRSTRAETPSPAATRTQSNG